MKGFRIIILILVYQFYCVNVVFAGFAGIVLDRDTGLPVGEANVFAQTVLLGANPNSFNPQIVNGMSNLDGYFSISSHVYVNDEVGSLPIPIGKYRLFASKNGYYTFETNSVLLLSSVNDVSTAVIRMEKTPFKVSIIDYSILSNIEGVSDVPIRLVLRVERLQSQFKMPINFYVPEISNSNLLGIYDSIIGAKYTLSNNTDRIDITYLVYIYFGSETEIGNEYCAKLTLFLEEVSGGFRKANIETTTNFCITRPENQINQD